MVSTTTPVALAAATLAIRGENVCRHYKMGETLNRAVDGISISVRRGEFVACSAVRDPASLRC